jgi:putative FmdB family regulatory protein
MPIYEFKCLECENIFELLMINAKNDTMEMKCSKCSSNDIERVMSTTNYSVGTSGGNIAPKAQARSCSSGSCTTIDLPGHSR